MVRALVISGPIASGKSTLARAVAERLADGGSTASVIDLDLLHAMLVRTPPKRAWSAARRAAASVTDAFVAEGIDVVVTEGEFITPSERAEYVDYLSPSVHVTFVTLWVSYPEALRRATADRTRGLSRDPAFLSSHYENTASALAATPRTDLLLDTSALTVEAAVDAVVRFVRDSN